LLKTCPKLNQSLHQLRRLLHANLFEFKRLRRHDDSWRRKKLVSEQKRRPASKLRKRLV